MGTCEHFCDLLLDHLYGLLEEAQAAELRQHLETCARCQLALRQAEGERTLLAQAARVCQCVPEFAAPDFEQPLAQPAAVVVPDVALPMQPALPAPRPRWRWLRYAPHAVAACLLVAALLGYREYQHGLEQRTAVLAQARAEVGKIDAEYVRATARFEEQRKQLPETLASKAVHVQISGPARYNAEVSAPICLETSNLQGQPQDADVEVQVADAASNETLYRKDLRSRGKLNFAVPAGLPAKEVVLTVQARTATASAQVQEKLTPAPPMHVTHLALNKASYHIGELLFFRTLTLEHFSLKPPETPIHLRYALVDLEGRTVKQLENVTGPGGIGGGEFALTGDIPSGIYFLDVTPQKGSRAVPQKRRLEIVRDSTPQFELDRNQYFANDKARITIGKRDNFQNFSPLSNEFFRIQGPKGAAGPATLATQEVRTDQNGQAYVDIPKNLNSRALPVELEYKDGKRKEKVVRKIPVVPSQVTIDFFPEGGDLVEGLPTRVYYRVRSPLGEPVDPQGRVIVLSSGEVLHDSEPGQGLGVFTLVPKKSEKYTVRITAPQTEIDDPFGKLGIQAQGLTLAAPRGVSRDGEPLRVALGLSGAARRLLVLVSCRGQIVEQKSLVVQQGQNELELRPADRSAGILRVTVYEAQGGDMVPLAERLVFRVPTRRLDVAASAGKGGLGKVPPGKRVVMDIAGKEETGKPADFWALAAVVDEQTSSQSDAGLPAHFYLASDVPNGEELEEAHLVLRDDPASWKALDLFLGTQGWRRFVPASAPVHLARGGAGVGGKTAGEQKATKLTTAFFSKENAGLDELRHENEARVSQDLAKLRAELVLRRDLLLKEKEAGVQNVNSLAIELSDYRDSLQRSVRLALGIAFLLGLIVSGLFVLAGLVQMVRQRAAAPVFVKAFVCLGVCLLLYFGGAPSESDRTKTAAPAPLVAGSLPPVPQVQVAEIAAKLRTEAPQLPAGEYAADGSQKADATMGALNKAQRNNVEEMAPVARRAELMEAFAGNAGGPREQPRDDKKGMNRELQKRFVMAQQLQDRQAAPGTSADVRPAAPPAAKTDPSAKKEVEGGKNSTNASYLNQQTKDFSERVVREYNWRNSSPAPEIPDTLLWHPALFAENGSVQVQFDLPSQPANYRVLIYGNTPEGRLGFFEGKLEVPGNTRK